MTFLLAAVAPRPNPTEPSAQLLRQRANYVAAHGPYVAYLHLLLDRASLPASTWAQPNVTNMAAMVSELRGLFAGAAGLNGIVLGRFLHRILSPLLTWHGGYHAEAIGSCGIQVLRESTLYRWPEVQRSRAAFEAFTEADVFWSNDFDQWQLACTDEALLD